MLKDGVTLYCKTHETQAFNGIALKYRCEHAEKVGLFRLFTMIPRFIYFFLQGIANIITEVVLK